MAYWGGGPEVRRRIEGLRQSSASLVLFLEYIPRTLHEWFTERVRAGAESTDRACALVERELAAGTSFMNAHGLVHFDAHFQNILTDGRRLYFADFGLALSSRFDLSESETGFLGLHRNHDRCYTLNWLVNWLITALYGSGRTERHALIHAMAEGQDPPPGPPGATALLSRHAPSPHSSPTSTPSSSTTAARPLTPPRHCTGLSTRPNHAEAERTRARAGPASALVVAEVGWSLARCGFSGRDRCRKLRGCPALGIRDAVGYDDSGRRPYGRRPLSSGLSGSRRARWATRSGQGQLQPLVEPQPSQM